MSGLGDRLAASWEQDVGSVVQVYKRKGKKEVRPKIATGAVRLSGRAWPLGFGHRLKERRPTLEAVARSLQFKSCLVRWNQTPDLGQEQ